MEIFAFVVTVIAGYFGAALLGGTMNWPDAGAFILHELRRK